MSVNNGKFINAFTSTQMIISYDSDSQENTKVKTNTENDTEADVNKKESVYNGNELYNPLEMDDSDEESTDKNTLDDEKELVTTQNISPISSPESLAKENNSSLIRAEEFSLEKSPTKVNDDSFTDDDLLGTALAEFEEEEKQNQIEKDEKEGKKKKKKKEKDREKDDKKKKKKKKKKKGKDKNKDREDKEERRNKDKEEKRSKTPENASKEKDRHLETEKKSKKDKKKDKKYRDSSRDRSSKNSTKHSSSREVESERHSSKKDKDKYSDHNNHRKRSHRSRSPDHNSSKRSRHSDVYERKSESREHRHRHSSRSPTSKDNSERNKRHSLNKSRNEHKVTPSRHEKKSDKQDSSTHLTEEEFRELQKEARKIHRQRSSGSSSTEQHRLVIEDVENSKNRDKEREKQSGTKISKVKSKSPRDTSKSDNNKTDHLDSSNDVILIENDQHEPQVDFSMIVDRDDMYDIAVSSHSESGSVCILDSKKSTKPGALSIHEYKERKKTGKDSRPSLSQR